MNVFVKFVAISALLLLTAAACWAYPRTVLFEDFTNYG